ncbi:twin-arginine translocase subunit TatC [Pseudalkalibacillus sp. SCS-8]|uniref:twin-arginine translocase subunit TatC n=1 Tax=Pseudalkalibacillus nanhaiensis TaxID=3115291 RepID=UPI0039C8F2C3
MREVDEELEVTEHLEELRKRIIWTLVVFILFLVGSFVFVEEIYEWLIRDLDQKLVILGPSDILWVYVMISGICAIAMTIPFAAFQIYRYIKPALNLKERKATLSYIPVLFLLFLVGISFGYFIVFPMVLSFMEGLSANHFQEMYTTEKYFRFMMQMTLPFGLLFELPVVILFLTTIGLLNPTHLIKARKVSYFVLVVVAVSVTPPDFISDFLVTIPLLLLYEISISLSKMVYKKKQKKERPDLKSVS